MVGRKPPKHQKSRPPPILKAERSGQKLAWLYGLHAVRAALANPRRRNLRLLGTSAALAEIGPTDGIAVEIADREALDRLLTKGAVHQGIALESEPLAAPDLDEILAGAPDQASLVVLDRANDPHNVGAVLRSAAVFGAIAVVVPRDHAPAVTGALAKAASGALEAVPLVFVANLARAMEEMKAQRFWCVGLVEDGDRLLSAVDLKGRTALVIGAEDGMRRLTHDLCDFHARLPTSGTIGALNMSNAAAIALYETVRQRG